MVDNIHYHLNQGKNNSQCLKTVSNEYTVLPYHVYKHQMKKKASQKDNINLVKPFTHINTLAQILYEAFHDQAFTALVPILFVFEPNIVTGISASGAYLIDFYHDSFVDVKNIDIQEFKAGIGQQNGPVAIGYMINQSESIQHSKEFMYQKLKEQTIECVLALQEKLHIHGELEEQIQLSFDFKKIMIPLIALQWIKQTTSHERNNNTAHFIQ